MLDGADDWAAKAPEKPQSRFSELHPPLHSHGQAKSKSSVKMLAFMEFS